MKFEWDDAKAASNERKHGASFADGMRVFDDPLCSSFIDRVVNHEPRWRTFGLAGGEEPLLMVAHTLEDRGDGEVVRIISVRAATRYERRRYEHR